MLKGNKIMPIIPWSHRSLKFDYFKKIFLISNYTLDELVIDTTHISLP